MSVAKAGGEASQVLLLDGLPRDQGPLANTLARGTLQHISPWGGYLALGRAD